MNSRRRRSHLFLLLITFIFVGFAAPTVKASFHLMQIWQVIGGVNGDTSAQAIELRMRSPGQNLLSMGPKLIIMDASGLHPITLITFSSDVARGNQGDTILITTPNFKNYTNNPATFHSDFTMNPIPASYLAAGRLIYQDPSGPILWSLAFGGPSYTGSTNGETTNGAFDPGKFAGVLPRTTLQALRYTGPATGQNNNNATDYALTSGAATFTNNAGTAFTLVAQPANPAQLRNIATRAHVQTGETVLIGGFVIRGAGSKRVILRGLGPTLTNFGVQGVLADPVLELHKPGGSVVTNDNWKSTQQAEIQATGLAPLNDSESAIVAMLAAGNYTIVLRGKNNSSGVGLIEAYDLNPMAVTQFINISSRGFVETGENVLIGGIVLGPAGSAGNRLLLRAIGPSLAGFGITQPLLDPTLELHNMNGALIAFNNDWKATQQAAIQATGLAPTNDRESAILFTAAAGSYTAIVRGGNATTGVAVVEAYDLP
jgi:hypothetical protein